MKYYLGLDIGIQSIGWAVSSPDDVIDFGVWTWDPPFHLVKGNKKGTKAENRRNHRASRRRYNRKRTIKRIVHETLLQQYSKNKEYTGIWNNKDIGKLYFVIEELKKSNNGATPDVFNLRYQVLKQNYSPTPQELTYILLNYINHRGLDTSFVVESLTDNKLKDKVKSLEASESAKEEDKSYYIGLLKERETKNDIKYKDMLPCELIKQHPFFSDGKIRNILPKKDSKTKGKYFFFKREDLKTECMEILKNVKLPKDVIKTIIEIVFDQIPFEQGPNVWEDPERGQELRKEKIMLLQEQLSKEVNPKKRKVLRNRIYGLRHFVPPTEQIEKCKYYPDEPRHRKSSFIFDLFVYIQTYCSNNYNKDTNNKLEVVNGKKVIEEYFLKLKPKKAKVTNMSFTDLAFYLENKKFINNLPSVSWKNGKINLDDLITFDNDLGSIFWEYSTPHLQHRKFNTSNITNNVDYLNDYKEQIYSRFSTGVLSLKIMKEAIEAFANDNKVIGKFLYEHAANITKEAIPSSLAKTFSINKTLNSTSDNTTVFRSLCKLRKLIVLLHKHFRNELNTPENSEVFEKINIEISGGFKLSKIEKSNMEKKNKENKKRNDFINNVLLTQSINSNENNRMMVDLFYEQLGKSVNMDEILTTSVVCVFSNKRITIEDIKNGDCEIDHIIPRECGVHSKINRILVHKDVNKEKGKELPITYIKKHYQEKEVEEYIKRVKQLYKGSRKLKFLLAEHKNQELFDAINEENQTALNDTRYIAKILNKWLVVELTKRSFIFEERASEEIDKNEWQNRIELIRANKVQQVSGLTTSFIRRNVFHGNPWGDNKGEIRKQTDWHHAIDGICLSMLQSKRDVEFITSYSETLRYFRQARIEVSNTIKKHGEKGTEAKDKVKQIKGEIEAYKDSFLNQYTTGHKFISKRRREWISTIFEELKEKVDSKQKVENLAVSFIKNFAPEEIENQIPVKLELGKRPVFINNIIGHIKAEKPEKIKDLFSFFNTTTSDELLNICTNRDNYNNFIKTNKDSKKKRPKLNMLIYDLRSMVLKFKRKEDQAEITSSFLDIVKKLLGFKSTSKGIIGWRIYNSIDSLEERISSLKHFHLPYSNHVEIRSVDWNSDRFIKHIPNLKIPSVFVYGDKPISLSGKKESTSSKTIFEEYMDDMKNPSLTIEDLRQDVEYQSSRDIFTDMHGNTWKTNTYFGIRVSKNMKRDNLYLPITVKQKLNEKNGITNTYSEDGTIILRKGQLFKITLPSGQTQFWQWESSKNAKAKKCYISINGIKRPTLIGIQEQQIISKNMVHKIQPVHIDFLGRRVN